MEPCKNEKCKSNLPQNEKYIHDFILCYNQLERHLQTKSNTKYILVFEDDVILQKSFFYTLYANVMLHRRELSQNPWLDIKLYLNPRLRCLCKSIVQEIIPEIYLLPNLS